LCRRARLNSKSCPGVPGLRNHEHAHQLTPSSCRLPRPLPRPGHVGRRPRGQVGQGEGRLRKHLRVSGAPSRWSGCATARCAGRCIATSPRSTTTRRPSCRRLSRSSTRRAPSATPSCRSLPSSASACAPSNLREKSGRATQGRARRRRLAAVVEPEPQPESEDARAEVGRSRSRSVVSEMPDEPSSRCARRAVARAKQHVQAAATRSSKSGQPMEALTAYLEACDADPTYAPPAVPHGHGLRSPRQDATWPSTTCAA
jgi:hypothetical protein